MNIHETLIIEGLLRLYEIYEYLLDFVYNQHHDACIDNRLFTRKYVKDICQFQLPYNKLFHLGMTLWYVFTELEAVA
jgi:hypothetical protein